jgi:hypothetical protein
MLDLAAGGRFEEIHPRYVHCDYKDCVLWSSVDRGRIRDFFPDGRWGDLPNVAPLIAIGCRSCYRRFVQSWTWERGHETWAITSEY